MTAPAAPAAPDHRTEAEKDADRFAASCARAREEARRDPEVARRFLVATGMYRIDPETNRVVRIGLKELNDGDASQILPLRDAA